MILNAAIAGQFPTIMMIQIKITLHSLLRSFNLNYTDNWISGKQVIDAKYVHLNWLRSVVLLRIWMLSNFHYNIPFVCIFIAWRRFHFDFVASVFGIVCYGVFSFFFFVPFLCVAIHLLSLLYLKYHFRLELRTERVVCILTFGSSTAFRS